VSANAGSLSASGGATATYSSVEGGTTGNPLGMASAVSFKGSGELDNGNTVTLAIDQDDKSAYSASSITIGVAGVGDIAIDQGAGGTGLDRIDDMIPTAWEETNGTAVGTGAQTISGVGGSMNIEWNVDSGMLPDGMSLQLAYSPRAGTSGTSDKAQGGDVATGQGWDVVLQNSAMMDGLNVFAGYSTIEQNATRANGDRKQYALGATYAVGGLTFGYEYTRDNHNLHAVGGTSYYENDMYGVSFAVNDDLSISYGVMKSQKVKNDGLATTDVELEANSLQMAYSMGGASLKIAETSVDNGTYVSTTANDKDGTTIALTLAF
jgi:outer membrane protein OmpU